MKAKACSFDYWRNYVPNAPDLTYDVSNFDATTIDLRDIVIQGSGTPDGHSPTPGVLERIPTQRGWRCTMQIVSPPTKGTAFMNLQGDELTYVPRSGLQGIDCLNYVLSNGTQKSGQGRIFLNLSNRYRWKVLITRLRADQKLHRFILQSMHAAGMPAIQYLEVIWYLNGPMERKDANGVNRVYNLREQVAATKADYIPYINKETVTPVIIDSATDVKIWTDFDNDFAPAFNGSSGEPYSPKFIQPDVEIEFLVYTELKAVTGAEITHQVDLDRPTRLLYRLSDLYGTAWWESGNIQQDYTDPESFEKP